MEPEWMKIIEVGEMMDEHDVLCDGGLCDEECVGFFKGSGKAR